jgi:hypothetical protein
MKREPMMSGTPFSIHGTASAIALGNCALSLTSTT